MDEKMYYKTKLEEQVGQNSTKYLQEHILEDNIANEDGLSMSESQRT